MKNKKILKSELIDNLYQLDYIDANWIYNNLIDDKEFLRKERIKKLKRILNEK